MSAYIVDKNHIVYLVAAAMSRRLNRSGGDFSWYYKGESKRLGCADYERAAEVANMIWMENVRSVSYRYPNESSATLPGTTAPDLVVTEGDMGKCYEFDPVQVLKSIDCLNYQSCEHPTWEDSEAYCFLEILKTYAIHSLPGYEDSQWGAPEPQANVVMLSSLAGRRARR